MLLAGQEPATPGGGCPRLAKPQPGHPLNQAQGLENPNKCFRSLVTGFGSGWLVRNIHLLQVTLINLTFIAAAFKHKL